MAKAKLHVIIICVVLLSLIPALSSCALLRPPQPVPTRRSPFPNHVCYSPILGANDPPPPFPAPNATPVGTVGGPTDFPSRVISVELRDEVNGVKAWNGVYVVVYVSVEYTGILADGASTGPWDFQFIGSDAVRICSDDAASTALNRAIFPKAVNGSAWYVTILPGQELQYYLAFDVARDVVPDSYLIQQSPTKWTTASLDLGLT